MAPQPERFASVLVCPADRPHAMLKALGQEVREVVFDLEDAVLDEKKADARAGLLTFLEEHAPGANVPIAVRVNDVRTREGIEDVGALAQAVDLRPDWSLALIVPKLESIVVAATLRTLLDVYDPSSRLSVQLLVESSRTLVQLDEIIEMVGGRLTALVFGPGDFLRDMQVRSLTVGAADNAEIDRFLTDAFHSMLVQSRASGLQAIDGPLGAFGTPEAEERLRASAVRAASLGVNAKWVIHPSQVPLVNEEFRPSVAAVQEAQHLWAAYQSGLAQGKGAVASGGIMVDKANAEAAHAFYEAWKHIL